MKPLYLQCECGRQEHLAVVELFVWPPDPELAEDEPPDVDLHISLQLADAPSFWGRLVYALRYVFRPSRRDYHWSDCMVGLEDVLRLRAMLDRYCELRRPSPAVKALIERLRG